VAVDAPPVLASPATGVAGGGEVAAGRDVGTAVAVDSPPVLAPPATSAAGGSDVAAGRDGGTAVAVDAPPVLASPATGVAGGGEVAAGRDVGTAVAVDSPPVLAPPATGAAGGGDVAAGRDGGTAVAVDAPPLLASPATIAAGSRFLLAPRASPGLPMASRPAQTQDARAAAGSAGAGDEDGGALTPDWVAAFAADVAGRSGGGRPIVTVLRPRTARAALERSLRATHKQKKRRGPHVWSCETCMVSCTSKVSVHCHLGSRRHLYRVAQSVPAYCHDCEREFDSIGTLRTHKLGRRHMHAVVRRHQEK